ncbi:MAG: hypothetical protein OSJ70_02600 [Bacilli bacterium]|nr:hypothetical protein [Bacilli bacterium]
MILDISKKEHMALINTYRKCKGIALVDKYLPHLSPLNKMYVIDNEEEWEKVKNEFPVNTMTVRCDSPRGVEGKLPEGQTFHRDRVNQYIRDVKKLVPDAVIILEDLKPGTNERIHTEGGFGLDVKIGHFLYIDYVGPSFGCGLLSRGRGSHESWIIPWDDVPFMDDSSIQKYKTGEINQIQYLETLKIRRDFLFDAYPDKKEEIIKTMPNCYKGIEKKVFRKLINDVVFPLYMEQEELLKDGMGHFGVEINVVEDGSMVPFEISVSTRFNDK